MTQTSETWLVRIAIVLGLIGALCGVLGDFFSTFSSQVPGAVPYAWDDIVALVAVIPPHPQSLGKNLAIYGMQLSIWGFGAVLWGARRSGPLWTVPPMFVVVFIYFVGCSYHTQLSLLGSAIRMAASLGTLEQPAAVLMIEEHRQLMWEQLTVVEVGIAILSVWLPALVLKGKTVYPKAFAAMSPFPVMGLLVGLAKLSGIEPLRMFIELTVFNIVAFLLIAVAAVFLWTPREPATA